MQRISASNKIIGYHTQEYRPENILDNPIVCSSGDAWLGKGYYFWVEEEFSKYWGEDFKMATGSYDVYKCIIDTENFLNTVFNEKEYYAFKNWVDKASKHIKSSGKVVTLKRVHEFLADNFWNKLGIEGIIYDDIPWNPPNKTNRDYSVVVHYEEKKPKFFYYLKRIQIVSFGIDNISNFAIHLEDQT